MELDRTARRILGSLIEKRWVTPEQYPLTLKALVTACNQKTSRDPVLHLHTFEVEGALLALREQGLVVAREREGGHVTRYAEKLTERLGLSRGAAAALALLMLRGPQTLPELSRRGRRLAGTGDPERTEAALRELAGLRLARLLPRRPGRKHPRWIHLLAPESEPPLPDAGGNDREPEAPDPDPSPAEAPSPPPAARRTRAEPRPSLEERIERLRREVEELRERVRRLEAEPRAP